RSVTPARWMADQKRLPGRAKWCPTAAEYRPGFPAEQNPETGCQDVRDRATARRLTHRCPLPSKGMQERSVLDEARPRGGPALGCGHPLGLRKLSTAWAMPVAIACWPAGPAAIEASNGLVMKRGSTTLPGISLGVPR